MILQLGASAHSELEIKPFKSTKTWNGHDDGHDQDIPAGTGPTLGQQCHWHKLCTCQFTLNVQGTELCARRCKLPIFLKCLVRWLPSNANCNAETPANWVQWAFCVFSPSTLHTIRTIEKNWIMKVKFSYRDSALFSRYSRMKLHIVSPDSNLAALNRAAECCQPIWAFSGDILTQKNETEIKRGLWLSR